MKKKILAIILARGGSKRLKNKNIKKLKNIPLINWTTNTAIKSKKFCNIIVSSDSEKILKTIKLYDNKILILKRPKKYANDKSTSEDAILHALKWYEKKFSKIDYITLLQPTSPFRSLKTINQGLKKIVNSKTNAVIAVQRIKNQLSDKKSFVSISGFFVKTPLFDLSKFVLSTLIPPNNTTISGAVSFINWARSINISSADTDNFVDDPFDFFII